MTVQAQAAACAPAQLLVYAPFQVQQGVIPTQLPAALLALELQLKGGQGFAAGAADRRLITAQGLGCSLAGLQPEQMIQGRQALRGDHARSSWHKVPYK